MATVLAQASEISCLEFHSSFLSGLTLSLLLFQTCLSIRSRPWDERRTHKQIIHQGSASWRNWWRETRKQDREGKTPRKNELSHTVQLPPAPTGNWQCTSRLRFPAEWKQGSQAFISLHCQSLAQGCPKGCQFTSTFSTQPVLSKFLL